MIKLGEYVKNYDELNQEIKTDNTLLRVAILEAYGNLCHYRGVPIEYERFDIDHIIPKENLKKENYAKWTQLKCDLNLPSDFEINSVLNYVPSGERFNRTTKGNKVFSQTAIEADLEKAKTKAPIIFKKMELLKSDCELNKAKAILVEFIKKNPDARAQILREITENNSDDWVIFNLAQSSGIRASIDILKYHITQMSTSEKDDYLKMFEVANEPKTCITDHSFNVVRSSVQISAYAPNKENYFPSYIIMFTKVTLSDMVITPNYEYTKNYLFKKVFSEDITKRGFFRSKFYGHDENVFLEVGNARFDVPHHTANELSEIIDKYYTWHTDLLLEIERKRGTLSAQLFTKDRYAIAKMHKDIWEILFGYIPQGLELISNNDLRVENGFGKYLKFWSGNEIVLCLAHAVINNCAYILWEDHFGACYMGEYWSFDKASDWFFKKLLPILFELNRSHVDEMRKNEKNIINKVQCFFNGVPVKSHKKELCRTMLKDKISDLRNPFLFIESNQVKSSADFTKIAQILESFYDSSGNWKNIHLNDKQIYHFFEAMLIILKKEGVQTSPDYLAGNLGLIRNRRTMKELIHEIEAIKDSPQVTIKRGIGFAIRNIKVVLEENELSLTEYEMKEILEKLKPLIEFYNRSNIIEKFGKRLSAEVLDEFQ